MVTLQSSILLDGEFNIFFWPENSAVLEGRFSSLDISAATLYFGMLLKCGVTSFFGLKISKFIDLVVLRRLLADDFSSLTNDSLVCHQRFIGFDSRLTYF